MSQEEVRRFFTIEGPFFEFESGNLPDKEFFLSAKEGLGYSQEFDEFKRNLSEDMEFVLARDVFNFFLDFKGWNLGNVEHWMLSNLNSTHRDYVYKRWPGLFVNFTHTFFSCDMGSRKPEEEIYIMALDEGGMAAEGCLFVDDKIENVVVAERLGIKSLQFTGLPGLEGWLRGFGFTVAPISLPQKPPR